MKNRITVKVEVCLIKVCHHFLDLSRPISIESRFSSIKCDLHFRGMAGWESIPRPKQLQSNIVGFLSILFHLAVSTKYTYYVLPL